MSGGRRLLVIASDQDDYISLFRDVTIDGQKIEVEQAEWTHIQLSSYPHAGVVLSLAASTPVGSYKRNQSRIFRPDFVLIRMISHGLPTQDHRNLVYGLQHYNVPCINSLQSVISNFERPNMYGALRSIQQRLGKETFPLIEQYYYSGFQQMAMTPKYPIVVKVGHVHSGYGKTLLRSHQEFIDLASIIALHPDYCTTEPFINSAYDVRIQKIGDHYRAYRRTGSGWKGGVNALEDTPVTETYKMWADECSKLFGGMDILAIDVVHCSETNKDYIIELNECSIGLGKNHEIEDNNIIRDLVVKRMTEAFANKTIEPKQESSTTNAYKSLEVELINLENVKLEIEQSLKKANQKVAFLQGTNSELKKRNNAFFRRGFGFGFTFGVGFSTALLVSYLAYRWKKQ
ncbi:synapsin II [Planoprotostelium fungivorum]|uniref:Synapsin II n=1 Tax=Planoprotostelium fungivorum TaxID=1890364 RepID=A0A2P6N9J9_9EUKA|nr:synapsin II [Planoprotostelium fungivorum]